MAEWRLWTEGDSGNVATHTAEADDAYAQHLRRLPVTLYEHVGGGKIPRNHEGRSYRLTSGSSILAATTLYFRRMKNCLEVSTALFIEEEGDAYDAVVRELLLFVLTDAYRCSGHCALKFGAFAQPHEEAMLRRIETHIDDAGVALSSWPRKVLTVEEGRELYLHICGLSPAACEVVRQLDALQRVRCETVCFLVATGVWNVSQMEGLLLACTLPDAIFSGGAGPADRHIHQFALNHARTAELAGMLENYLVYQWQGHEGSVQWSAQEHRDLQVRVTPGTGTRRFHSRKPVSLEQWTRSSLSEMPAEGLAVLPIAARRNQLEFAWQSLVSSAKGALAEDASGPLAVAVPAEFDQLLPATQQKCLGIASDAGIDVLVAPDTFAQLSADARKKLNFARIIRR